MRLGLSRRAKAPRDWSKAISTAVEDAAQRRAQAVRNREAVLAGHLTEHTSL